LGGEGLLSLPVSQPSASLPVNEIVWKRVWDDAGNHMKRGVLGGTVQPREQIKEAARPAGGDRLGALRERMQDTARELDLTPAQKEKLQTTCHFQPSMKQNTVGNWQSGCSRFCCRGGSSVSYISTTVLCGFCPRRLKVGASFSAPRRGMPCWRW
jgi:hypothetical protein